jgi:tetratricopeptide (TPR) repeat protein
VTEGKYLLPGRPLRAADLVSVVAALPGWRGRNPELYSRVRSSLQERIPTQAGALVDYLSAYDSNPCLRRRVKMNLERADFQGFYRGSVEAGGRFGQACKDLKRKDYAAARAHLDEALVLSPDFLDAYRHRAIVESLLGEDEQAGLDYREGRKTAKDDRDSPVGACLCLPGLAAANGRLEERLRRGEALKGEGIDLFLKGERSRSASKLDAAIAVGPGDAQAYQSRAVVREALGDAGGAAADYEKAAALSVRQGDFQASALLSLARLREKAGDSAGTQRELKRALSAAPADWPERGVVARRLAKLEVRQGIVGTIQAAGARLRSSPGDMRARISAGYGSIRRALTSAGEAAWSGPMGAAAARRRLFEAAGAGVRRLVRSWPARRVAKEPLLVPAPSGPGLGPAASVAAAAPTVAKPSGTKIIFPFDGTLFPSDIRSPEIRWEDGDAAHRLWRLDFSFRDPKRHIQVFCKSQRWTAAKGVWEDVKRASLEAPATLEIRGMASAGDASGTLARIGFSTSKDAVGAPIFFRAVPNPFPDPKDFVKVKWKLGWVSSYDPPTTVMRRQDRCFNCHIASFDGKSFGFEYNPVGDGTDRGGYLVFDKPGKEVLWKPENFFDWNDYVPAAERKLHQAILSAVSPDGKFFVTCGQAMTNVNLVPIRDLIGYELVTKGILLYYSPADKVIRALPGGDDEHFVQVPTSWSPDGKTIYFSRARITPQFEKINHAPMDKKLVAEQEKLGWRELDRIYPLQYDVYRIPFNGGKGGPASPVAGAARNGKSNIFARISPDGKWLVFTQSGNGLMFVREDSDLYIIPPEGGTARRLGCNGPGADSWHSWSPNSRWLVFASKSYGSQTDLVLTHIDEKGRDSPPIVLTQMRDEDGLSANLPEFFNIKPGRLQKITPRLDVQVH